MLTGAYNRGENAAVYALQNNEERVATARAGLEKLHPGDGGKVAHGMSIAWQYMPHRSGGWASDTALEDPEVYKQITTFDERGRFFCAGDTWSYWPGWQEGCVASAYCAISAIANVLEPNNPKWRANACFGN